MDYIKLYIYKVQRSGGYYFVFYIFSQTAGPNGLTFSVDTHWKPGGDKG